MIASSLRRRCLSAFFPALLLGLAAAMPCSADSVDRSGSSAQSVASEPSEQPGSSASGTADVPAAPAAEPDIAKSALSGLQFGAEARASNIQFPWDQTQATIGSFPADSYFWGGAAWISMPAGEGAAVRVDYETDPVLRNLASATLEFERGIALIATGPLMGFLNSSTVPVSGGLTTMLSLQWPGIAYVRLRSAGGLALSFGSSLDSTVPQALTSLEAGFYTYNAIVSGGIDVRRFSDSDSSGSSTVDYLQSYHVAIEAFKKNVPYRVKARAGYEKRSKYYSASAATDSLSSLLIGLELGIKVFDGIEVLPSFSYGASLTGSDNLADKSPSQDSFYFTASLGFSVDLEQFQEALHRINASREMDRSAGAGR